MSRYNSTAHESKWSKVKFIHVEDFGESEVFGSCQSRHIAIGEHRYNHRLSHAYNH